MTRRGLLSDYFDGAAVKRMSAVEADPDRSHQHEFAGGHLRKIFGDDDRQNIPARFIWLGDEQEAIAEDGQVSWYDSRRKQAHRGPEYRLYYFNNSVTAMMEEGDAFFVAVRPDGAVMIVITPRSSTIQRQLEWLFDLNDPQGNAFNVKTVPDDSRIDFAARYILDELGIDAEEPGTDTLDRILEQYGTSFPSTREFSTVARNSLKDISALDDADTVLVAWLEREESFFRRMERRIVHDRLKAGFFANDNADVDGFLAFSLSVQNRRKSRAGQSLENHLEELFKARGLQFQRGVETENRNRPDFLFPGQEAYRDESFSSDKLTMLGAKSTCKDRWRQVLSEAARISGKHLLTIEPGISENQTDEMKSKNLQLVLPAALFRTYREPQQNWLMNVDQFIKMVQSRQPQGALR